MPDDNKPPAPPSPLPPQENEGEKATFSVTKEDWEASKRERNALAAELRLLKKSIPAAPPAPVEDEEAKTQKEQLAAVRKQLKRQEDAARAVGIRAAITKNGIVDPDQAEILFDHLERKHGTEITTDLGTTVVKDETGETRDIGDFVADLLKGPKGKVFRPEKTPGPNARGGRGGSAPIPGQKSVMEMSMDERLKMPRDQMLGGFKAASQS